jgi:hypothetical protein
MATCGTSGNFNSLTCEAKFCNATQVSYSNFAATGSITGVTGQVSNFFRSACLSPVLLLFWLLVRQ